jgi:hypothetical protein
MLARIWENLLGRVGGPMTFRLILQPAMATYFAVKAGLADGRANKPPYLFAIVTNPVHRKDMLHEGWKSTARIFALAIVMDVIYQIIVLHWVYPGETLLVSFLLACVPYLLIRGPVGRLARRFQARKEVV